MDSSSQTDDELVYNYAWNSNLILIYCNSSPIKEKTKFRLLILEFYHHFQKTSSDYSTTLESTVNKIELNKNEKDEKDDDNERPIDIINSNQIDSIIETSLQSTGLICDKEENLYYDTTNGLYYNHVTILLCNIQKLIYSRFSFLN
jgi:hypothetical protein